VALVFVAFAALRGAPAWLVPALLVGYAAAWTSHAFIEHNRPATFRAGQATRDAVGGSWSQ
jgi:hypothetical protein